MSDVERCLGLPIAVLTLTRDRLDFTKHCFEKLEENAGCLYDHFVLDQASEDGTGEWLGEWVNRAPQHFRREVVHSETNIGISAGMNRLLEQCFRDGREYDVVVKFDNDCELTQADTLDTVCFLAFRGDCLLSPRILGLNQPPQPTRELRIGDEIILDIPQIGGIFLAAPAWIYDDFRYSETNPLWGMDDVEICRWFRAQGGTCGYVKRLEAWHYLGTDGQRVNDPSYFARKDAEFAS